MKEKETQKVAIYEDLRLQMDLAKAYLAIGDLANAEKEIKNYISLNKDNPEAYFILGNILADSQNFKKAINSYKKAINIDNYYIEAIFCLGLAYIEIKSFDEVESIINTINKFDSSLAEALNGYNTNIN